MFLFRGGCTVASWTNLPRACKHTVETDPGSGAFSPRIVKGILDTDTVPRTVHPSLPCFGNIRNEGRDALEGMDGQMEEKNVKFR